MITIQKTSKRRKIITVSKRISTFLYGIQPPTPLKRCQTARQQARAFGIKVLRTFGQYLISSTFFSFPPIFVRAYKVTGLHFYPENCTKLPSVPASNTMASQRCAQVRQQKQNRNGISTSGFLPRHLPSLLA